MLIKIELDDDSVDALKRATGHKVGSKAVARAALQLIPHTQKLVALENKVRDLELQISAYRQLVKQARTAAALLLEKTAQQDAFLDG